MIPGRAAPTATAPSSPRASWYAGATTAGPATGELRADCATGGPATAAEHALTQASNTRGNPSASVATGIAFDAVLVAERYARPAFQRLTSRHHPVGAVIADGDTWIYLVPTESGEPAWPAQVRYLSAGDHVPLPPARARDPQVQNGQRWIRYRDLATEPLLTAPLPLLLTLAALVQPAPPGRPLAPPLPFPHCQDTTCTP